MEDLKRIIQTEFTVSDYYTDDDGTPTFILPSKQETKIPFQRLIEKLEKENLIAILRKEPPSKNDKKTHIYRGKGEEQTLVLEVFPRGRESKRRSPLWNLVLFIATICTVTLTGYYFWAKPYYEFGILVGFISAPWYGWYTPISVLTLGYVVALLSITTTHEFGHYFISKKNNVEASLPFFIPGPPPIGTFGAVIFQRSPVTNRDKLFDIGLMGPITGFIIALLVAIISIKLSPLIYSNVLYDIYHFEYQINLLINDFIINVYNNYPPAMALTVAQSLHNSGYWPFEIIGPSPFSEPLLFSILVPLLRPEVELGSFFVNPLYWSAWVGFLITALNLFPIGMLDGGHMFRAILDKRTHYFASIIVAIILTAISYIYIVMALVALLSIRKGGHPGALDDVSPLTTSRKILFIVMMFVLIITIPPLGWKLLI